MLITLFCMLGCSVSMCLGLMEPKNTQKRADVRRCHIRKHLVAAQLHVFAGLLHHLTQHTAGNFAGIEE
jgi:hypothetical protein